MLLQPLGATCSRSASMSGARMHNGRSPMLHADTARAFPPDSSTERPDVSPLNSGVWLLAAENRGAAPRQEGRKGAGLRDGQGLDLTVQCREGGDSLEADAWKQSEAVPLGDPLSCAMLKESKGGESDMKWMRSSQECSPCRRVGLLLGMRCMVPDSRHQTRGHL